MNYKINDNDVIIFPTDTVYGIGCKMTDEKAIERIYDIKKRDTNKRLAVLISSLDQIKDYIEITDTLLKIESKFWPGALTVIVPLTKKLKYYEDTIGIRIPNSKLALDILKENGAMATTSVNISGMPPLDTYQEIYDSYSNKVDKIYQKIEESSSISSTVIILKDNKIEVIREGKITKEEIEKIL